jgi:hypothetical protein
MTLATGQKKQYDGNDSATNFPFPYYFKEDTDLVVIHRSTAGTETTLVLDTDYTVTGEDSLLGNVEFPTGGSFGTLATGERIAILREKDLAENTDLEGNYQWDTLNDSKDNQMMIDQQLQEQINRSHKQPVTDSDALSTELPNSIDRASKLAGYNALGEPIAVINITNTITSGDGAPTSTPSALGDHYIDTTNDVVYEATGTASSADWKTSTKKVRHLSFNLIERATDVATDTNLYGDFVMPFGGTILQSDTNKQWLMANNTTAGVTGTMVVDIHKNGTTIMATNKLDIETGEKTTEDATTQPDLTVTTVAAGDIITFDIDAIHSGTAAKGLAVTMTVLEDG